MTNPNDLTPEESKNYMRVYNLIVQAREISLLTGMKAICKLPSSDYAIANAVCWNSGYKEFIPFTEELAESERRYAEYLDHDS